MRFAVVHQGDVIPVEVPDQLTLADFKAYLEAETSVGPQHQKLVKDGNEINGDDKSLSEVGLVDGDMVQLLNTAAPAATAAASRPPAPAPRPGQVPASIIESQRQQILNTPQLREQIIRQQPEMEAVLQDPVRFRQVMEQTFAHMGQMGGGGVENSAEYQRLMQNPDDPESQKRIMELIQQEAIDENYRLAYEITPEAFTHVNMLYIELTIKGHKIQAFVDSGAQVTCISPKLAQKVGIDRLIDKRMVAEIQGVGRQTSGGRIHSVPITVGDSKIELPCSFTVIDTNVDLLFGLDMLRRHRAIIDLEQDKLILANGTVEARFLSEGEIVNNPFSPKGPDQAPASAINPTPAVTNTPAATTSAQPATKSTTTPAAPSSHATQASHLRRDEYTPSDAEIQQLVNIGFSPPQARQALIACNGNVELAASMLFN
ncbi:hypothetical protein DIURU_003654 [Diutina rugosa]|uniref:DNA damage-inducible protein 1 n=1 Tax=Diutina rugosa TaxID=5481 RepID=A0A642US45_DIURU|nr:uncharacterized protein DIURU_003654 [Diutina rugosa]KAA8900791.1 hypothetical protein DIURU_003654 [Diutina rugosa]